MLGKLRFVFEACEDGKLRGYGGEAFHGLFFELFTPIDGEFFGALHSARRKPFSIYFDGTPEMENGWMRVKKGERFSFVLSVYNNGLLKKVIEGVEVIPHEELKLGGIHVRLEGVFPDGAFQKPVVLFRGRLKREVEFRFLSPSTFRKGKKHVVFPEPVFVFHSLLSQWDAFPLRKRDVKVEDVLEEILVKRHAIRTELVEFSRYRVVGFVGRVVYGFPDVERDVLKWLNALSRFAVYAGVGYKTTMGLGRVEVR